MGLQKKNQFVVWYLWLTGCDIRIFLCQHDWIGRLYNLFRFISLFSGVKTNFSSRVKYTIAGAVSCHLHPCLCLVHPENMKIHQRT